MTDKELLEGMSKVLTRVVEERYWNTGMSISQLRQILKTHGTLLISRSANSPEMKDALAGC